MKSKIIALSLFLLLLVQSASALSVLGTITVQPNEEFTLIAGQTAILSPTGLEIKAESIQRVDDETAQVSLRFQGLNPNQNGPLNVPVTLTTGQETEITDGFGNYEVKFLEFIADLGNETPAVKLVVTSTPNPPQPGVLPTKLVELGQAFSLVPDQTAEIVGENLKLKLLSVIAYTPQPCNSNSCPSYQVLAPHAKIVVSKESGNEGTATEQIVYAGQTIEVFGYKIENRSITANPQGAEFVVTKLSDVPDQPPAVTAKLNQTFGLFARQTATVKKSLPAGETVLKVTLDKTIETQVQCIRAPCIPLKQAHVTISGASGIQSMALTQNNAVNLGNNLEIEAVEINDQYALLVVRDTTAPRPIEATLDKEFELKKGDTAKIQSERILLRFDEFRECTSQDPIGCKPYGFFSLLFEEGGASGVASFASYENEYHTLSGYKIWFGGFKSNANQTPSITIKVSKSDTPQPTGITVNLGEKFELKTEQTASVLDNGQSALKVRLDAVDNIACIAIAGYKCDDRAIVQLSISKPSSTGSETGMTVKLREGEKTRQFGDYVVYVLDVPSENSAVLLVKKIEDDTTRPFQKVSLGEKFRLTQNSTVLVSGPDIFIYLEKIDTIKTLPPQYVAFIRVSKGMELAYYKEAYKLYVGESLDLYGVTIKFLEAENNGRSGLFVVEQKPSTDPTINVHVDEPFWLNVNQAQAANVLQANMRLDLLGISFSPSTCPNDGRPCAVQYVAIIGVNTIIGGREKLAKYLPTQVTTEIIKKKYAEAEAATVGSAAESQSGTVMETLIDVPPTPFNIFELAEGQEVTVNDFTIKALAVNSDSVQLIVRSKPLSYTVNLDIVRGWNLFSLPGEIQAEKNECNTSDWKIFEYNTATGRFDKVSKTEPGHAYWVYTTSACRVKAEIRNPVYLQDLKALEPKWNFVPITIDMIGQKITDLGDCQVRAAFEWNNNSRKWQKTTTQTIAESDLGKAWAVYANNACRLGGPVELTPPELPPAPEGTVWLKTTPVQCEQTSWGKWFSENNLGDNPNICQNKPDGTRVVDADACNSCSCTNGRAVCTEKACIQPVNQERILQMYYRIVHNIQIQEFQQTRSDGEVFCQGCGCSLGVIIQVRVSQDNVQKMRELGWETV